MSSTMEAAFQDYGASYDDLAQMGPEERWLSLAAGAFCAGYGLSKLRLRAIAALGAGAYLVYRGSVGRCPLRERLAAGGLLVQPGDRTADDTWGSSLAGESELDQFAHTASADERSMRKVDLVDEAAEESFPASDPPGYTGASATPSKPIA